MPSAIQATVITLLLAFITQAHCTTLSSAPDVFPFGNESPCGCGIEARQTCCKMSTGSYTARNACTCTCNSNGTPDSSKEKCSEGCPCPKVVSPVCCRSKNQRHLDVRGLLRKVVNECKCICEGGVVVPYRECQDRCGCPPEIGKACCRMRDMDGNAIAGESAVSLDRSSCECACGGDMVVKDAECRHLVDEEAPMPALVRTDSGPKAPLEVPTLCKCKPETNPVCCEIGPMVVLTKGVCDCTCNKKGVVSKSIQCKARHCVCPAVYDPVCCKLSSGNTIEAENKCKCTCLGGSVAGMDCLQSKTELQ